MCHIHHPGCLAMGSRRAAGFLGPGLGPRTLCWGPGPMVARVKGPEAYRSVSALGHGVLLWPWRLVYRDLDNRQEVILPQTSLKAQRADPARAGSSRRGPVDCHRIRAPKFKYFQICPPSRAYLRQWFCSCDSVDRNLCGHAMFD